MIAHESTTPVLDASVDEAGRRSPLAAVHTRSSRSGVTAATVSTGVTMKRVAGFRE